MRRQQLTEAQITALLLNPPTDQRELIRHYTLSAADLGAIRRCRGDHNRQPRPHAFAICAIRAVRRRRASGRRGRFSCSSQSRLTLFRSRSRTISPRSGTEAELHRLGFRPFGTRPAADLAGQQRLGLPQDDHNL